MQEAAWSTLLARLYIHDWVVYAKHSLGEPKQVLDYLGRYTHRVAISIERILGMDADAVRLRVRDGQHGNRRHTIGVPAHTFIERCLLHVLPKGSSVSAITPSLGPAGKAVNVAQARAALSAPVPDPRVEESVQDFLHRIDRLEWSHYSHCGKGRFVPTAPITPDRLRLLHLRGPP